jgi:hypothetical protein
MDLMKQNIEIIDVSHRDKKKPSASRQVFVIYNEQDKGSAVPVREVNAEATK